MEVEPLVFTVPATAGSGSREGAGVLLAGVLAEGAGEAEPELLLAAVELPAVQMAAAGTAADTDSRFDWMVQYSFHLPVQRLWFPRRSHCPPELPSNSASHHFHRYNPNFAVCLPQ